MPPAHVRLSMADMYCTADAMHEPHSDAKTVSQHVRVTTNPPLAGVVSGVLDASGAQEAYPSGHEDR